LSERITKDRFLIASIASLVSSAHFLDGVINDGVINKVADIESIIQRFVNSVWGLGLPFSELLAWLAILTELVGAILLLTVR
jgi:uncharacterized membrane protein YphA (DoxX/SURF4 family)